MNRALSAILLILMAALAIVFVVGRLRYLGKAPVELSAENCDATLWKHVYSPARLSVIEPCTAVEGRVASVQRESDGDLHIALDPDVKSVLNIFNVAHAHGHLIVEAVCDHASASRNNETVAACAHFTSQIVAPVVGSRVRVVGAYVTDTDGGWNEIHPVTRVEPLQ